MTRGAPLDFNIKDEHKERIRAFDEVDPESQTGRRGDIRSQWPESDREQSETLPAKQLYETKGKKKKEDYTDTKRRTHKRMQKNECRRRKRSLQKER